MGNSMTKGPVPKKMNCKEKRRWRANTSTKRLCETYDPIAKCEFKQTVKIFSKHWGDNWNLNTERLFDDFKEFLLIF